MTPYDYQSELSEEAYAILCKHNIVYLAMEERTGKTLTGLMTFEKSNQVQRIGVLTKKKALPGWQKTLGETPWRNKEVALTNYHMAKNLVNVDALIIDEAHAYISAFPKPGVIWAQVKKLCAGKLIIFMSATPNAQGRQMLYHQFALSDYSPWKQYKNGYAWFDAYALRTKSGGVHKIYRNGLAINDYTKVQHDKIWDECKHLFITKTRKELNFEQEPEDILHWLELSAPSREAYNILVKDSVLNFTVGETSHKLICDGAMKLRMALHMLEGGVLKIDEDYIVLKLNEKIDYILATWGDSEDVAIMYQYIAEGTKLRAAFKHAHILQGISYAEGIDLSHVKHLIIYSQDFSASRHTQRRARQANLNRTEPIKVHFLLVKKALSHQVYTAVSLNKKNFVDSLFERNTL